MERAALNMSFKLYIIFFGQCCKIALLMPEVPGALFFKVLISFIILWVWILVSAPQLKLQFRYVLWPRVVLFLLFVM